MNARRRSHSGLITNVNLPLRYNPSEEQSEGKRISAGFIRSRASSVHRLASAGKIRTRSSKSKEILHNKQEDMMGILVSLKTSIEIQTDIVLGSKEILLKKQDQVIQKAGNKKTKVSESSFLKPMKTNTQVLNALISKNLKSCQNNSEKVTLREIINKKLEPMSPKLKSNPLKKENKLIKQDKQNIQKKNQISFNDSFTEIQRKYLASRELFLSLSNSPS